MRKLHTKVLAALLFAAAVSTVAGAQNKTIQVGDTMPGFFLKDIDGEKFFLKDYVGDTAKHEYKAIIFSMCASYCKPCKKEIPELGRMVEKYRDRGLGAFLIALEKEDQAKKMIAETETKLPVLIDRYLIVPKLLKRDGIPFTLLVDGSGTVRYINTGFSEGNAPEFIRRFEQKVAELLGVEKDSSE